MFNHDPNYGDNTTCDLCRDVFDVRNSPHEILGDKWICGNCCTDYDYEELQELISSTV